jgi:glycosyltransferase involved in cell wall biosynthesis
MSDKPILLHITADPNSLAFLQGQAEYMRENGFEVQALSSPGAALEKFGLEEKVVTHAVPISRTISPLKDILSIYRLWKTLRRIRPAIVDAHMSKAGLLGTIAARLAGVPVCLYHNHGMAFFSSRGVRKLILRVSETAACAMASQVITVSPSVRDRAVREGLCRADKIKVLLSGSINGLDAEGQFNPENFTTHRELLRSAHYIPEDAVLLGYVGRITAIKGINELISAWKVLRETNGRLHLMLVGNFDDKEPVTPETKAILTSDPRIHMTGFIREIAPYFSMMDLLVLPSYHEGFPVVLLEGAAMGLPIVATAIPGNVDAVIQGCTGALVPPHDVVALCKAIQSYVDDRALRMRLGKAGRHRVLKQFRKVDIWNALQTEYRRLTVSPVGKVVERVPFNQNVLVKTRL